MTPSLIQLPDDGDWIDPADVHSIRAVEGTRVQVIYHGGAWTTLACNPPAAAKEVRNALARAINAARAQGAASVDLAGGGRGR